MSQPVFVIAAFRHHAIDWARHKGVSPRALRYVSRPEALKGLAGVTVRILPCARKRRDYWDLIETLLPRRASRQIEVIYEQEPV